jgi:hypothetical protein
VDKEGGPEARGVGEVPPDLVQDIRRVPHLYRGLPR